MSEDEEDEPRHQNHKQDHSDSYPRQPRGLHALTPFHDGQIDALAIRAKQRPERDLILVEREVRARLEPDSGDVMVGTLIAGS